MTVSISNEQRKRFELVEMIRWKPAQPPFDAEISLLEKGLRHRAGSQNPQDLMQRQPSTEALCIDEWGLLPPALYAASAADLISVFGFNEHRLALLRKLKSFAERAVLQGVTEVFLGGSFLTAKERPGDIDLFWESGWESYEPEYNGLDCGSEYNGFFRKLLSVRAVYLPDVIYLPVGLLHLELKPILEIEV